MRRILVGTIKPLLSEEAWQRLRRIDPRTAERDRRRAARASRTSRSSRPKSSPPKDSPAEAPPPPRRARPDLSQQSLTYLATHFGTDKWGRHRYTPHYERHLGHLKQEEFTLLEIGIGGYKRERTGGASLKMWKHFFPRARILGLDIEDKSFVNDDRILAYRGSQVDQQLLRTIVSDAPDLRVVIDDGSHRNEHVLATFQLLFPLLPDGAVYAIEDTQTSYWERYGGAYGDADAPTTMNMVKALVDGLNYEEFTEADHVPSYTELHVVGVHAYHNLVFIEKGLNNENRGYRPSEGSPSL